MICGQEIGVYGVQECMGQGESKSCRILVAGFIEEHGWGESNKVGLLGMHVGQLGAVLIGVLDEALINNETFSQSSTRSMFIVHHCSLLGQEGMSAKQWSLFGDSW